MMYAAYVPSVGIYGIGPTIAEALCEAAPFIDPEEEETLTILPTGGPPDTERDCDLLKVRRCTEDVAKLFFEHGVMAAFALNDKGILDLDYY